MSYKEEWEDCCGHCAYHRMNKDIGWVCSKDGADAYGCETDYSECCECFEPRRQTRKTNRMASGYSRR